ncbi:wall-associated receptor kinase-like 2 [Rutidosis leptorrhynchoides]|uniref:wall-associated receptor kinase-like 2 n=1 Tax=Rutidosis leptorrhynchoides TaxID=125765 RepID=UPI003A99CE70
MFEKLLSDCEESKQIIKIFTEEELKKATNNFNSNNVIGQGGFGTVYKVETAGALDYMHSSTKIIHRDIKSSNILLDDDYTVKVSNFGISRSVPKEIMEVLTAVQGTLGYIGPEYFSSGILTEKSDVYNFGVLVVELLTGEKVNSLAAIKRNRSLVDHFIMSLVNAESLVEILDDQVKVDCEPGQLNQVVYIVKSCLQRERQAKPMMRKVKEDLLSVQTSLGLVHSTQEIVSFISNSDVPE